MSFIIGIAIYVCSVSIPSQLEIGILWPVLLAGLPSFAIGLSNKSKLLGFSLGVLVGLILWVVFNFSTWAQMSVILTAFHVMPAFIAILIFAVGDFFSPLEIHGNHRQGDAKDVHFLQSVNCFLSMKFSIALVLFLSVLIYSLSYTLNTSYLKVVVVSLVAFIFLSAIHWGDWLDTDKVKGIKEWHIFMTLVLLLFGSIALVSYFPELEVIGAN